MDFYRLKDGVVLKTILLTNHYAQGPYEVISNIIPVGYNLKMLSSVSQDELENTVSEADYILASGRLKINKRILDKALNVKMIQRTGVGLDTLDLEELKKRNIPLYVNQGINSESVAEHTLLLMLSCLRRLTLIDSNTRNGVWKKQEQGLQTFELAHKKVGLVGMGNIAQKVVNLLKPFRVEIFYYDVCRKTEEEESVLGLTYLPFDELISMVDILSFHCPLTDSTRHMLNSESIKKIKNGIIVINTARGPLIEEQAIVNALKKGLVSFAGLDVHENEPLINSELMNIQNVILTPHIGGVTYDSFRSMMNEAIRNIVLFDQGRLVEIERYKVG